MITPNLLNLLTESKHILIIKRLTDLGLIHFHLGFSDRREGGFGRVSRIWPSKALISHFTNARLSVFDIHYHDARESVVLRNKDGKDIEYSDTQETKDMRDVLGAYNDLLPLEGYVLLANEGQFVATT